MADRYEDQYRRDRGYRRDERGFMDRAGDEVRSWFGDDDAERRRHMDDRERGQFRDRDYGNSGPRPGADDRRYGQSSEYGSGSSSYGQGNTGYSQGGSGYGYGAGGSYGSSDRGQFGNSDRHYGSGDRGYGDRSQSYGAGSSFGYGRQSGSESFRGATEGSGAYGGGSYGGGSQREDRDRGGMGWFTGRGPKGYQRSDTRINDDVCDRLCDSAEIDASEIEVQVANGEVTLTGSVSDRSQKRRVEDLIEQVSGVREVHNNLRVSSGDNASRGGGMTGSFSSSSNSVTGTNTGTTTGSSASAGTGTDAGSGGAVTGEQPGNVLGVGGGAPDRASSAGSGRR